MTQFDYEVLTADKIEGVTKESATDALQDLHPDHFVIVEDHGTSFVATLARRARVGKTTVAADDDALDILGDESKEDPKAEEKELSEEDGPKTPKEPKEPKEPKGLEDSLKDDEGDDDKGGDEVTSIIDALKTLEKLLPKVKDQLGGGDDLLDDGLGGPPAPGGLPGGPPHGHPAGPEGLGPLGDDVGPTPGGPPLPGGPGAGLGKPPIPPRRPPVPAGGAPRPGVPNTFGGVNKNKVVIRQIENEDGTRVSMAQASDEIEAHPKYAGYEVINIRRDGESYKAHLKFREG